MQIPDSFDEVIIALGEEKTKRQYVYFSPVGSANKQRDLLAKANAGDASCRVSTTSNEGHGPSFTLSLPNTFGVTSKFRDPRDTRIEVTVCKDGHLVYQRSTLVAVPKEGDPTRLLRFPIPWMCAEKGKGRTIECAGCGTSPCYGRPIANTEHEASQCVATNCPTSVAKEPETTVAYDSLETARYGDASQGSTGCFDVLSCFDLGTGLESLGRNTEQLAVDWQYRPTDAGSDAPCIATLNANLPATRPLQYNVALVLPPNTQGTCNDAYCLIPLQADSAMGFSSESSSKGSPSLLLPSAVCRMLDSGQVLSVIGSTQCEAMTAAYPVCAAKPSKPADTAPTSPETTSPATSLKRVLQLELDESDPDPARPNWVNGSSQFQLSRIGSEGGTPSHPVSGVSGLGQSLDSQNYLRSSESPPAYGKNFSVVSWVSLTELASERSPDEQALTVVSNIGANCLDGFRITLERCKGDGRVLVGFARPVGYYTYGTRCMVETQYAVFGEESWDGGYYTPWKRGSYRQIAVSYADATQTTRIYLDGEATMPVWENCVTETTDNVFSDDSLLYIGSSKHLAKNSTSLRGPVEVDEVSIYDQALTDTQIRQTYRETLTIPGPGMHRWGSTASQGSSVTLTSSDSTHIGASIEDRPYGYGGLSALLNSTTLGSPSLAGKSQDLSHYDEAVFWADRPKDAPLQFSLSADQGMRFCVWLLDANQGPLHVINLHQPSYCSDPDCYFDLSAVERAAITSDYATGRDATYSLSIRALAFRRRSLVAESAMLPSRLGTSFGPYNFCFRAVSKSASVSAQVDQLAASAGESADTAKVFNSRIKFDVLNASGHQKAQAELTLDFPRARNTASTKAANTPDQDSRNFLCCKDLEACVSFDGYSRGASTPDALDFVFRNRGGQTYRVQAKLNGTSCYRAPLKAALSTRATEFGGTDSGSLPPNNACAVLSDTVRLSIPSSNSFTLHSLSCCADNSNECELLSGSDPTTSCEQQANIACP